VRQAKAIRCFADHKTIDMETLSRLTGKDFSGPTPQISAPPPPDIGNEPQIQESQDVPGKEAKKVRKRSKTPAPTEDVEVVGDIDNFEPGFVDN
jgi:transcription factor TFIIIB component B''